MRRNNLIFFLTAVFSVITCVHPAAAQANPKFQVLYNFEGGKRGGGPSSSLVADSHGDFYGVAGDGIPCHENSLGCGVVYKIARSGQQWKETVLYLFHGGSDGAVPSGSLVLDGAGNIYGTTTDGGGQGNCMFEQQDLGCGTAFELTPSAGGKWKETVLHRFAGGSKDGANPVGGLVVNATGHVYGVTSNGGDGGSTCPSGCGTIFELSPSGKGWTYNILHNFTGVDGFFPTNGMILTSSGDMYGTTTFGGSTYVYQQAVGDGVVFELKPTSSGQWKESVLYSFTGFDGDGPSNIALHDGEIYGTTVVGGIGYGNIFALQRGSDRKWTEKILYHFTGERDGDNPAGPLAFGGADELYGSTTGDVQCTKGNIYRCGSVFRLSTADGAYRTIHRFTGGAHGEFAEGVITDATGRLYGNVGAGGTRQLGFVFEMQP